MSTRELLEVAQQAAKNAYAPYSNYRVGAALLSKDGSISVGCNVENASYGLSNCAERTAVFSAVADGKRDFVALAIVAYGESIPLPCGACRQVLSEFCTADFNIHVAQAEALEKVQSFTLNELLPHTFTLH